MRIPKIPSVLIPTDGMVLTGDTVFQPGTYYLPHGITIASDGITLDGSGALLVGQQRTGQGVNIENCSGVTIKNLCLQEFYHGLHAEHSRELTIANCRITSTAEVQPNTIFLNIWLPADKAYGGGILLREVKDSLILSNDLQHQMSGLLAYGCRHLTVRNNVASYSSGAGFHLHETCDSLFENNYADFCCRYEPRGERSGHMGADAAGFVIVYRSCRNVFRGNFARLGGDGFFLAGLTPEYEPAPCDENLFEENDASYSPNIAFEATFSQGNIYRNNSANRCNYGFWLGFSRETIIENNRIRHNRQAGIAVENGADFKVRSNTFEHNGHGVLLWSKHVPEFAAAVPENETSHDWWIEDNTFRHNDRAIRIAAEQDHGVQPLKDTVPAPRPHDHFIRRNRIEDNRIGIELVNADNTLMEDNLLVGNLEADIL